jgi:hypothetical protein
VNAILLKFFSGFTTKPSIEIPAHVIQSRINEYLGVIYQSKIDFRSFLHKDSDDVTPATPAPATDKSAKKYTTIGKLFPDLTGSTVHAFDVINKFNLEVAKDQDVDALDDDDKELVLKTPSAIIGHLADAAQYFPSEIIKLNPLNLLLFKDRIKALCNFLQTARSRTEMILLKPTYKFKGYERQYMSMLSLLATYCCAGEKMEELYMETERRKNKILERLTLKKFYEEHPGLEHKAGVPKGGTFVVLYAARNKRMPEPPNLKHEVKAGEEAEISRNFLAYFRENDTELKKLKEKNPALHEKIRKLLEITHVDEIADLVIGDFCLPYQLSSKLPPLAYVIEKIKEPLLLNLPGVSFCSNAGPVKFSVMPENGMVAAKDDACSAAVEKTEDTWYFVPKNVPPAFFGLPVSFTVNGQPPDKAFSVKVYEQPVAGFNAVPVGTDLTTNSTVEIAFTANPDRNPDNFTYSWTFHDGSVAAGKTCTKVFNKLELIKNHLKEIPVTLKATNGTCSDTITISVPYTPYERIKLSLPVPKTCENGAVIPFSEYAPQGSEIASPEAPKAIIHGVQPAFNPALVEDGALNNPIHFTVNGKSTACQITVYSLPEPGFRLEGVEEKDHRYYVTIKNLTREKDAKDVTYSWEVNAPDKSISQHFETKTVSEPVVVIMTYEEYKILSPKKLIVKLLSDNHGCRSTLEKEISVTMGALNPCLEQMFGVFTTVSELLLSQPGLEKRTKDKNILVFNEKVNKLYINLLKQKENFAPTYDLVKKIKNLIEALSKLKASDNTEKEYLDDLFVVLFAFLFGVIKCADCKTLLKTEIQALMPAVDDEFGRLIREMISRFKDNTIKVNQIDLSAADFLSHRRCPSMDGFLEELRAWLLEH